MLHHSMLAADCRTNGRDILPINQNTGRLRIVKRQQQLTEVDLPAPTAQFRQIFSPAAL